MFEQARRHFGEEKGALRHRFSHEAFQNIVVKRLPIGGPTRQPVSILTVRHGDDRKLLSSNESITISDDNTSKTVASQCAIGRMGPLCNKCGPFGEYIEMQHPEREGRTYCASCEELEGQGYDYEALTTSLGMFLLVAFHGINLFMLTRGGMLFQMLDADDSGSVEIDEYLGAVREYAGYTKDQISYYHTKK